MSYRLLLDENVERPVGARLESLGHDVEWVASDETLGKGTDDATVTSYLRQHDRILVTYDDDFLSAPPDAPILYVPDETLSGETVADIVNAIAGHYPQDEVRGVTYAGRNWL